ncbi:UPF0692 protein C19orf54 homolog [Alosa sapidissima]|uniref:UPF0692 protein C19orf54 homolog n=1 Tax=Alosa sapidissima TaxID=34773 RepID=UPI001C08E728|nr:UPF0692 protein C19orf54 homolog [Alosa sapidissima]
MSMEHPNLPPPPPLLPPPPPPPPPTVPGPSVPGKKKLYQAIAEGRPAVEGDHEEALCILKQREIGFRKDLQWLLLNKYVPSLIQDGPQCGLVALWMASQLLQPARNISMDVVVQTALTKGYTVQGEMFSAKDMTSLAQEVCGCKAELLKGGMDGVNFPRILRHLIEGQPVLIPYDEDFNHEPCQRSGHRAHWAAASGILVGLTINSLDIRQLHSDPSLPWVFMPREGDPPVWSMDSVQDVYVLAKQGKSLRYQLWNFGIVTESNRQLRELDPQRANDGTSYVLPPGGVEMGLAGQAVLLHTKIPAS